MSDNKELHEVTWSSDNEDLLRLAVDNVVAAGVAAAPIVRVEWGGTTSWAVRLCSPMPLAPPPAGIRIEVIPAAGVFMQGPRHPTPNEWMDRLPPDRQVVILEALQSTPRGRLFALRMAGAKAIDPDANETKTGVSMLLDAGVISAEEATILLAP